MPENRRYTESAATTVARVVVFALVLAIVAMFAGSLDGGPMGFFLLAFVALGLVADAAVAWLGGARGRVLVRGAGMMALFWLAMVGLSVVVVSGHELGGAFLLEWQLTELVMFFGILGIATAAIALLPRVQAIVVWLLASWVAPNFGLGNTVVDVPGWYSAPTLGYVAIALVASTIGVLGLYVRIAVSKRNGWRPLAWRLMLVALTVVFSVAVSTIAIIAVGRNAVITSSMESRWTRQLYALRVSQHLSSEFDESRFATSSPALDRELVMFAAINNVGLTVYDRDARRVVVAVRQKVAGENTPNEVYAFMPVSIGASETAAIAAAADAVERRGTSALDSSESVTAIGWLPMAQPLGYREGHAPSSPAIMATGSVQYPISAGTDAYGTRFFLVVTEARAGWTEFQPIGVAEVANGFGLVLAPWLFLSFMLPCTLGLLALDRRDTVRAKLSAAEERARLNRDAHDRVYNRLAALANRLAAAQPADAPAPSPADEIRRTVSDLQGILGDGAAEPRTAPGDAAVSLMEDVCADQGRIWGMDVTLQGAEALHGVDPRLGWELQCIVEEALTNAGRHARTDRARVTLSVDGGTLRVEIADEGSGIAGPLDKDGLPLGAGGMRGMAERTRDLGGTLTVETGPEGTTVTAEVPFGLAG